MSVSVTVDTAPFARGLQRFVQNTGKDADKAARHFSRVFIRYVVGLTPPGDGKSGDEKNALTKADEYRARGAILSDLSHLFIPVRLKGKRPEEWPDVAGLHRQAFITGKMPGKRIKRVGQKKYVDQSKLKALQRELFARIGKLAASWLAGVDAVGAKGMPAWVRRHGVRGFASITPEGSPKFRFVAGNPNVPAAIAADQDRRYAKAAFYTSKRMDDALRHILAREASRFQRAA